MIKTDSHLHTSFSSDSDTPMEDMILAGIEAGMEALCFTDHHDPDFPNIEDGKDFLIDFDAYETEFLRLKEMYGDRIGLYLGVEIGVQPHLGDVCNSFYRERAHRYDFIIHSTHVVDHLDPYVGEYFRTYDDPKRAISHYFEVMLRNLEVFSEYQTVGHLDYICRYEPHPQTPFRYEDYSKVIDPVLLHIIGNGKCLEINTAGWKYGMEDPNPCSQILTRYRELGGSKITIGSDGHKPEHLAYDFHRIRQFLKDLGFDSYYFYKKQEPVPISL